MTYMCDKLLRPQTVEKTNSYPSGGPPVMIVRANRFLLREEVVVHGKELRLDLLKVLLKPYWA